MKNRNPVLVLVLCAGCNSSPTSQPNQAQTMDLSFHKSGERMRTEPVPYPKMSPYDASDNLKLAYMDGFKFGWEVVIDQGPGALVSAPDDYGKSEQLRKAWRDGYDSAIITWHKVVSNGINGAALVK